jgi:hypothetical protein
VREIWPEPIDHSPWALCLAKVFEREIALSIVHWFRDKLGVELPAYFDKYQPEKDAKYLKTRRPVDFNIRSRTGWRPPTLGDSLKALEVEEPDNLLGVLGSFDIQFLIEKWKAIIDVRNMCAHATRVDEVSVLLLRDALSQISQKGIFDKLYRIKQNYRGNIT